MPTAVITGASAGIGAATARALSLAGFRVALGARRHERLTSLAQELANKTSTDEAATNHASDGDEPSSRLFTAPLDVTDDTSVAEFVAALPAAWQPIDLLVNNAGGAAGLDHIAQAEPAQWRDMFELNVLGVLRLTRALLPQLLASGNGMVINIGSVSGFETYPGGAGYCASKHALRAVTRTLRQELLGKPVRITEINPGLVESEFALVRFDGDEARAAAVYRGMTPLCPADVANCVVFAATRPAHVNIDEIVVRPRDQVSATQVHRRP